MYFQFGLSLLGCYKSDLDTHVLTPKYIRGIFFVN